MSDAELLREYVESRSQPAFAALVERHLNLVYSVARRHVRSPDLANDIAQSVFIDLAQKAPRLRPDSSLAAWLHLVSRRTAIDFVRREISRRKRETVAAELSIMNSNPESWEALEPLLDEAVESLSEPDRTAILLRFFHNQSFGEVGAAVGSSDDAAQKRVSRAVDRLREFFIRRGVAVTSATLASNLSAHAILTPPIGLSTAIVSSATAVGAGAVTATSPLFAMSTVQKSLAVVVFAATGGLGWYEARVTVRQTEELAALRLENRQLAGKVRQAYANANELNANLNRVERQIDGRLGQNLPRNTEDATYAALMTEWLGRLDALKAVFDQHPEFKIPELELLSDEDWNQIAGGQSIESDRAVRELTAKLRHRAENAAGAKISDALRAYLNANGDILPSTSHDILPYLELPNAAAILDRYAMRYHGKYGALSAEEQRDVMATTKPIDPELDSQWTVGPASFGNGPAIPFNVRDAVRKYKAAHGGQGPATPDDLKPYLAWPLTSEQLQKNFSGGTRP